VRLARDPKDAVARLERDRAWRSASGTNAAPGYGRTAWSIGRRLLDARVSRQWPPIRRNCRRPKHARRWNRSPDFGDHLVWAGGRMEATASPFRSGRGIRLTIRVSGRDSIMIDGIMKSGNRSRKYRRIAGRKVPPVVVDEVSNQPLVAGLARATTTASRIWRHGRATYLSTAFSDDRAGMPQSVAPRSRSVIAPRCPESRNEAFGGNLGGQIPARPRRRCKSLPQRRWLAALIRYGPAYWRSGGRC
jgi:hypothetical protein